MLGEKYHNVPNMKGNMIYKRLSEYLFINLWFLLTLIESYSDANVLYPGSIVDHRVMVALGTFAEVDIDC